LDRQLGIIGDAEEKARLVDGEIEIPEIERTINGTEIQARMALDTIYSTEKALDDMAEEIESLKDANRSLGGRAGIVGDIIRGDTAIGTMNQGEIDRNNRRIGELEDAMDELRGNLTQ